MRTILVSMFSTSSQCILLCHLGNVGCHFAKSRIPFPESRYWEIGSQRKAAVQSCHSGFTPRQDRARPHRPKHELPEYPGAFHRPCIPCSTPPLSGSTMARSSPCKGAYRRRAGRSHHAQGRAAMRDVLYNACGKSCISVSSAYPSHIPARMSRHTGSPAKSCTGDVKSY